jgi:O-antigen/teichoic acid export membrane protein
MSNLLAKGEDVAPIVLRTVRRAAIVGALVFPVFAASSPELVPALFGEKWREAAEVIPYISLSTLILGSTAVATSGYLSAVGRPGIVAWATAAFGVVWLAITGPLLSALGVQAIGVGNLCGAFVEVLILNLATARSAGVAPYRRLLVPVAVATAAGTVGWLVCTAGPAGILTAVVAGGLTLAIAVAGLLACCTRDLIDLVSLAAGAVRGALESVRRAPVEVGTS